MIYIKHSEECQQANIEWFAKWPNACRSCRGTGVWGAAPSAQIEVLGVGQDGKQIIRIFDGVRSIRQSCKDCTGRLNLGYFEPLCPRCAALNMQWVQTATNHTACHACSWNRDDHAPSTGCNCSEYENDQNTKTIR